MLYLFSNDLKKDVTVMCMLTPSFSTSKFTQNNGLKEKVLRPFEESCQFSTLILNSDMVVIVES